MEQKVKLHLGCGTVYLTDGFTNIDIETDGHYLAANRPDLVEENGVSSDVYYKNDVKRSDIVSKVLHKKEVAVDLFADVRALPFEAGSVDEIWAVQLFEHFSYADGRELLKHWYKLLKVGGKLFISIPDLEGSTLMFTNAKDLADKKWAARLLFGSQKNEYGYHKGMYDEEMVSELLEDEGFTVESFDPKIKHFYPTIQVTATV
jgi:predicted SAM-dependent methyltransferase